jgi:hypothetical protein
VESRPLGPGPHVLGFGSPINTVVWYFQVAAGEIRVIDIDMDLDLTPVERVSRMLAKGYLYGSHFLPHDPMATQKSGRTFSMELTEARLAHVKAVPRTYDVWIGINKLRGFLPRFSFRVPECERGIAEAEAAHMLSSAGSTSNIRRQPVTVRTGFRGNTWDDSGSSDNILDRFFGKPRPNVRVIR